MKNFKTLIIAVLVLVSTQSFGQEKTIYVKPHKNPGAAFALGLFIPGAGQMYNDQVGLGFAVFGGTVALAGGGYLLISESANATKTVDDWWGTYEEVDETKRDAMMGSGIALLALGGALHVAAFVYAPLKSKILNKKNGDPAYANSSQPNYNLSLGITRSGGVGITLSL